MLEAIRIEVDALRSEFHFNEEGLEESLKEPIKRDLAERAVRVESLAKQYASGRPGPNVRTGRLRGSITWRLDDDQEGPFADVGTAVFYAPFVELGTNKMPAYPFLVPALEAAHG